MISPDYVSPGSLPPQLNPNQEVFLGILGGVANHEAKLAVTAIMAHQPDRWFTRSSLFHEVMTRQGDQPGWAICHRGPIAYCEQSLEPVGLVAKGVVASGDGQLTAFKANDDQPQAVKIGHAISGALLDWSLEFPDLSLQRTLGVTAKKGKFRTPEVRYRMYKALLDDFSQEISYTDIGNQLNTTGIDLHTVYANLTAVTDSEILETHTLDSARDITLQIVNPNPNHNMQQSVGLKPEIRLAYDALKNLWAAGKREITFEDFVSAATNLDPDMDIADLRSAWHYGSSARSENMPGLKLIDRTIKDMKKFSTVSLNPKHDEAVMELVIRLDDVATGEPDVLEKYKERANDIVGNRIDMAKIFAKAKEFSANAAGADEGSEETERRILSLFRQLGSMTVKEMTEQLGSNGRKISRSSIIRYLNLLEEKGALKVDVHRGDASNRRRIQFYSLEQNT
jgi:Fe2+ or Zn2+ uptake regulation protein